MVYSDPPAAAHKEVTINIFTSQNAARLLFCTALLATAVLPACQSRPTSDLAKSGDGLVDPYQPAEDLGPLFHDVQMKQIFADGKTFVDMPAKSPPDAIRSRYLEAKDTSPFELQNFVTENFLPPNSPPDIRLENSSLDMLAHINALWPKLIRPADAQPEGYSTLIPLPHPYIVPGGRFREIYYWDSYFTMLGLVESTEAKMARALVENFAWLIDNTGHIPNGNRTYYLSRSQPPFFAAMVHLLEQHGLIKTGEFLPQLEKEYQFWMAGESDLANSDRHLRIVKMPDGAILNRYFDALDTPRPESYREDVITAQRAAVTDKTPVFRHLRAAAESGWDFSSRWLTPYGELPTIHTTEIVPVDLNSLLYSLEMEMSRQYAKVGDPQKSTEFLVRAEKRKHAIQRWLWDEQLGLYGDYSLRDQALTGIASLASVYPLYFSLATPAQAERSAHVLQRDFLKDGGFVTTLQATGEQWDFPNGWAPLQWLAITGLRNYGFDGLAGTAAQRWLALNQKVYRNTGRMMEKYNVVDITAPAGGGEYPTQDGFGWTNGVAVALSRLYPDAP